jgi:AcrR family transcriptional regulator
MTLDSDGERPRPRPGGRSARVRSAVLLATAELLAEGGYDNLEVPVVARRAGVHPTTVYRRWPAKAQLVGEALLERSRPLTPTPDTGSLATDLEQLLFDGVALVHTPAVRALFQMLMSEGADATPDIAAARDRFWAAHHAEAAVIVDRAMRRSELPHGTDPAALIDLVIGPVLLRLLLMGQRLEDGDVAEIVARAITGLGGSRIR